MGADDVLTGLLVVSLGAAVLLILISAATVGRKLADLEFQAGAGIDGVRRIQAWINVRTHANRVFLGVAFVVITILLLADAPLPVRTWANRVLFALVMVSYLISSAMDWVDERKQLRLIQDQEQRRGHRQAFAAGVASAEAGALAQVAVVPPGPDAAAVTIESIAPEAVDDIVDAIKPAVTEAAVETLTGKTPT